MAETSPRPVAVVVGVGAGLGAALARRFASGYTVALLARGEEYLTYACQRDRGRGWTCTGSAHRRESRKTD